MQERCKSAGEVFYALQPYLKGSFPCYVSRNCTKIVRWVLKSIHQFGERL
jgi:hypothetical protein